MSISVQNLSVSYGANTAIRNISFTLDSPGMHGIIGPNGSGKSTLMKAMLQILDKHNAQAPPAPLPATPSPSTARPPPSSAAQSLISSSALTSTATSPPASSTPS